MEDNRMKNSYFESINGGNHGEVVDDSSGFTEEKIFVAVGENFKENTRNFSWVLQNFREKRICVLHVHRPLKFTSVCFKPPTTMLTDEEDTYKGHELQRIHNILNEYVVLGLKEKMQVEKLVISMDEIDKGIVDAISLYGIRKLVMGAASNKHFSRKLKSPTSRKALFVVRNAEISCHVLFVCNGRLVYERSSRLITDPCVSSPTIICGNVLPLSPTGKFSPETPASINLENLFQLKTTHPGKQLSETNQCSTLDKSLSNLMLESKKDGRYSCSIPYPDEEERTIPGVTADISEAIYPSLVTRNGCEEAVNLGSNFKFSEEVPYLGSTQNELGSEPELLLHEREFQWRKEPFQLMHHRIDVDKNQIKLDEILADELYNKLLQAMDEAIKSKDEAYNETLKRQKAEKDAIKAIYQAKFANDMLKKEMEKREELNEKFQNVTLQSEQLQSELEHTTQELKQAYGKIISAERKITDFGCLVSELEENLGNDVIERLKRERNNAIQEKDLLHQRNMELVTCIWSQNYALFSFSEIESATHNFHLSMKIGEGEHGIVYKCLLRNTPVAVKMLYPKNNIEFFEKVNFISSVRHPNLVTPIGACFEARCFIYEYQCNGNLEDWLIHKDGSHPLSWQTRVCIATDICVALFFLHTYTPFKLYHGAIKPTNILLDANFTAKLSDFGISGRIEDSENTIHQYYDINLFGIFVLQLLTGRMEPSIKEVREAIIQKKLEDVLDKLAGDWPYLQSVEMARLGLNCCKTNPPNMSHTLKKLEQIRMFAKGMSPYRLALDQPNQIPHSFICPIFQEIMENPHIASDGHTYEYTAIQGWFDGGHDTSPMTNAKLSSHVLIPNHVLRSMIQEWLQGK